MLMDLGISNILSSRTEHYIKWRGEIPGLATDLYSELPQGSHLHIWYRAEVISRYSATIFLSAYTSHSLKYNIFVNVSTYM